MNLKSAAQIEIDFNSYKHTYSKNVSMVVFPTSITKIKRAMMYVEANGYRHPVIINNNHFTLPIEFHLILSTLQKIKLLPIIPEQRYFYFMGSFVTDTTKRGKGYYLTIDRKIRKILHLKKRDIIEVKVENNIFYAKVWWQTNEKSMLAFFPSRIFEMLCLKSNIPYQIKIKKSREKIVNNAHFYAADKLNLEFNKFLKNGNFNLHEFLENSYANTEGGKSRKFRINKVNDNEISICYTSGGPISREIKIKPTFIVSLEFFRMMGLLQAECSKSTKKNFCFTNETPENIRYVIEWFEKYWNFSRKLWLYELSVDPRIRNREELRNMWANSLKINPHLVKVYPKICIGEPNRTGIMNLRSYGRTLKETIMRLLECTRDYVSKNKKFVGYFLSGVLAGDGYIITAKEGSLNYIGISFDPNKVWSRNENELKLYILCLKTLGIPNDDIKIYIGEHKKAKKFIKSASKYGVKIKVHKGRSIGFGGEINIFKFRSFQKLAKFDPFFPNELNARKFASSFNKIDRNRIRFL